MDERGIYGLPSAVDWVGLVGFTPGVNAGILSSTKDSILAEVENEAGEYCPMVAAGLNNSAVAFLEDKL